MLRNALFYFIAFVLLIAVALFFTKVYHALVFYTDTVQRHNTVYSCFQDLSKQIDNAAISNPDLAAAGNPQAAGAIFFADSASVMQQYSLLKLTVRDSLNIAIANKLDLLVKRELPWLLKSNVPDSIIHHKAIAHIDAFHDIDSLIEQGLNRTKFLISFGKKQLNDTITKTLVWMAAFILLSCVLLIYTTGSFLKQKSYARSKQKELEKSVREISDYKYAIDESSIVAITDQSGIIKYVNNNFCDISKYNREELLGRDHRIINSGHHSKDFIRNLWVTIANGKIWKGELKNKAKDGTIYWVDTTIVPFLNEKGKPFQYLAIRADITSRKQAEEMVAETLKAKNIILESIGDAFFAVDKNWIVTYWNRIAEIALRVSKQEVVGKNLWDIFSGSIDTESYRKYHEAIATNQVIHFEDHYPVLDKWYEISAYPSENGLSVYFKDITHRKDAEQEIKKLHVALEEKVAKRTEQLATANKDLESFSYSVAHDLRTPLRAVSGYARMLEEDYNPLLDIEGKRLIFEIENNAKKMGMLIDDLLTFSKLGRKEIQKTTIDMAQIVDACLQELQLDEVHRRYVVVNNLDAVMADPALIKHVMINLISNAVKYSSKKEQPHIEITSRHEKKSIIFSIADNGVGFDMEYAGKLFGVFQRLHSDDEFEGTGVGLAIVQRIVHRHNGEIWAKSKVNEGATFYFSLPA
jgi:PAS domain S-box-containing protein